MCLAIKLLLLLSIAFSSQGCPSSNITILTEEDLQQFIQCQTIEGDLVIGVNDCSQECTITNLGNLNTINVINGDFVIQCCNQLTNTPTLSSLKTVLGSVRMYRNSQLINIGSLSGLTTVENVEIYHNPSLISITGFGSLVIVNGYISVGYNPHLTEISGFDALITIKGEKLANDHGLIIIYNPVLVSISGFHSLVSIAIGTVHIEGNTMLCYAGYPTWNYGGYGDRYSTGDKGIDWRKLIGNTWQFTWDVGMVPSLLIRDNGNESTCALTKCSDSCVLGGGCLGPEEDPSLCGECYVTDDVDSCSVVERPSESGLSCPGWWPPTEDPFRTLFILVVSVGVAIIVLVVVLICVVYCICKRNFGEERKGGYFVSGDHRSPALEEKRYETHTIQDNRPYHSPNNKSYSKERTVIGRGAGSSTSSTPSGRGNLHMAPPTHRGRLANDSMSSMSSSRAGRHNSGSHLTGNGQVGGSRSPSVTLPSNERLTNGHAVHYTSTPNQLKDPLKESAKALQSISERPISVNPPVTNVAVETHKAAPPEERQWEVVSDVGEGMQENLRDEVWSEENDSFEEEFDGEPQQQDEDVNEFPSERIRIKKLMGKGSFGRVYEAEAYGIVEGEEVTSVVVKQANDDASDEELQVFLQPADAMKYLKDESVLQLLGVSVDGMNVMIIMEHCSNDNLKTFLKKQQNNAMRLKHEGTVHQIIVDIANGVSYLHSMAIAHNDLAARNCLVTQDLRVKIGDYGYSRTAFRDDYYSRTPGQMSWPVRWMSPEVLVDKGNGILDSLPNDELSNVWSYGIIIWEVCTFGDHPYPRMTDENVIELLKTARRCNMENPAPPSDPAHSFYNVMTKCWVPESERAQMHEILELVKALKDEFQPVRYSGKPSRPAPKKPAHKKAPKPVKPVNQAAERATGNGTDPERVKVLPTVQKNEGRDVPTMSSPGNQANSKSQENTTALKSRTSEQKNKFKESKPLLDGASPSSGREEDGDTVPITLPSKRDSWGDLDENLFESPATVLPPPEELENKDTKKVKKTKEKVNDSASQRTPKRKAPQGKGKHKATEKQQQQQDEPKTEPKPVETSINEDHKQEEPVEPVIAESFVPPPIRDSWTIPDEEGEELSDDPPIIPPPVANEEKIESEWVEDQLDEGREISRSNPLLAQLASDDLGSLTETDEDDRLSLDEPHPPTRPPPVLDVNSEQDLPLSQEYDNSKPHPQEHEEGANTDHSPPPPPVIPTDDTLSQDADSWDEFEVEDTPIDQLVDPPSLLERKESFILPPDSPETTPTLSRRPSYLTPHEEIEEEEREEEEREEEEREEEEREEEEREEEEREEEEREEEEEEREEEEGEEVTPPPIPSSLPPEDNENAEGQQDGVAVEREDEEPEEIVTKQVLPEKEEDEEEHIDEPVIVPVKLDFLAAAEPEMQPPKESSKERKEREKREKREEKDKKKEKKEKSKQKKAKGKKSDLGQNESLSYW